MDIYIVFIGNLGGSRISQTDANLLFGKIIKFSENYVRMWKAWAGGGGVARPLPSTPGGIQWLQY